MTWFTSTSGISNAFETSTFRVAGDTTPQHPAAVYAPALRLLPVPVGRTSTSLLFTTIIVGLSVYRARLASPKQQALQPLRLDIEHRHPKRGDLDLDREPAAALAELDHRAHELGLGLQRGHLGRMKIVG